MKRLKVLTVLAAAAATFACAGTQSFREAREEETLGHWDVAVLKYGRAADLDPSNENYRMALIRAKARASQVHFEKGKIYRSSGAPDLAVVELEQAVVLDPTNKYAETELRKAREEAARLLAERSGETTIQLDVQLGLLPLGRQSDIDCALYLFHLLGDLLGYRGELLRRAAPQL